MIKEISRLLPLIFFVSCGASNGNHSGLAGISSGGSPSTLGRAIVTNLAIEQTLHSFMTDNGLTTEPCIQWVVYEDHSQGVELSSDACPPGEALVPKEMVVAKVGIKGGGVGSLFRVDNGQQIGKLFDDDKNWIGVEQFCTGHFDNDCTILINGGKITGITFPPPPPVVVQPPRPPVSTPTTMSPGALVYANRTTNLMAGSDIVGQLASGGQYTVVSIQGSWVQLKNIDGSSITGWADMNALTLMQR